MPAEFRLDGRGVWPCAVLWIGPDVRELVATAELQRYASLTDPVAHRERVRQRVFPRSAVADAVERQSLGSCSGNSVVSTAIETARGSR